MPSEKPDLNQFLREKLNEKFGSLRRAAETVGMPYERLRMALRRNTFNLDDLDALCSHLEDVSSEELSAGYSFDEARSYVRADDPKKSAESDPYERSLIKMRDAFQGLKKIAKSDGELEPVVLDLFEAWHADMTMFLFYHRSNEPVEWDPQWRSIRTSLNSVLLKGGNIIYVVETADEVSGEPSASDDIDLKFNRFVSRLIRENDTSSRDSYKGRVVLVRVPHCSFCVPDQKPSLFAWRENDDLKLRAFTTADIPETLDGHGTAGTIIIPQPAAIADKMLSYLDNVVSRYHETDSAEISPAVRLRSFPEHNDDANIQRLARII